MSNPVDPSRVYVGNVNYNATEDELKEFFQDFNAVSVEIPSKTITRGERTFERCLGFGFVQFENEADAESAINEINGKKFKLRQIYAKKALPPATEEEKEKKKERFLAKQAELKAKKREVEKQTADSKQIAQKEEPAQSFSAGKSARKAPRASKTPDGKKSTDTIFVTNLDYKANLKSLSDLFKDLCPIWVNVPTKRVPFHVLKKFSASKKPIFNKGIAFVKFADEATQLRAVREFNGREVNGKNIVVEVAIDKPASSDAVSSESSVSSEAATSDNSNASSVFADASPNTAAPS
ncbi:hypothetical protein HF325_006337 [Metschnikowia pulcherrima]|uniref:RRM domain-containing protein n=1 Tax=Metschnikowia pulcherrima TaxID=27326 RepID=A0A8H7GJV9_9ASCO|nr:hypothetical protein HF325_006337 [Metschnikowia pulcherrima]